MTNVFEGENGQLAEAEDFADGEVAPTVDGPPPAARPLSEQEEQDFETLLDAYGRWDERPVPLQICNPHTAWLIMGVLQLAWRNPGIPFRDEIERFGRQIQDAICDTAEIAALAEAGWNLESDRADRERRTP